MQFPEAIGVGRQALAMLTERGNLYEVAEVGWQVRGSALFAARWGVADELKREVDAVTARVGHVVGRWCCAHIDMKRHLVQTADLAASIDRASRDFAWAEEHNRLWRGFDLANRAGVHFYAGNWDDARVDYDEALKLEPGGFLDGNQSITLVPKQALRETGRPGRA